MVTTNDLHWDLVFKHLPAPCLMLDQDFRIMSATDMYLASVERSLDSIRGQYVFDAFPEEPERLEMFRAAFRKALDGEANALNEVPFAIPIVDADGAHTGKMREVWWNCLHSPVFAEDGSVTCMVQKAQDITKQVQAERLKDAIAKELDHRVGNILTLVSAVVKRTAANSDDIADFLAKFDGRIAALSRTHKYLTGDNWDAMTIEKIVSRELEQYRNLAGEQIEFGGSEIKLNASEAQVLTLAVHELTTNSVKHGALRASGGKLDINWAKAGDDGFHFEWRETAVQPAQDSARKGFGSFILDQIIPSQLQAEPERGFEENAYFYRLSVPQRISVQPD